MFSASMSGMTSRKLIDDEYRGEWMGDYLIGEYFELYQGQETPHKESLITAENINEAKKIANRRYGWGSWASRR